MANYNAKDVEHMRAIAKAGGIKSGEVRRLNALRLQMLTIGYLQALGREHGLSEDDIEAELRPMATRGGAHDNDWRCPACHHFNAVNSRQCSGCGAISPVNGRLTRAALRRKRAEHRTSAILGKHSV